MSKPFRPGLIGGVLLLIILALSLAGVMIGVSQIQPDQALGILLHGFSPDGLGRFIEPDWRNSQAVIINELRAPRVILAMLAGAGLAVAGAALQAATRNPLTDPFLLGVSSGASLGAVLVISHVGLVIGAYTMPVFSFAGGLLSFLLLLILMKRPENQRPDRLVLAGVAISFLLMAGTNGLIFLGDQRAAQSVVFWMLGGLGRARWDLLPIPTLIIVLGVMLLIWQARNLNALMMGQESAAALGISVNRVRITVLLLATLVTSLIVSLTGTIGFVGLVVPHIMRTFIGGDNRILLPVCALAGAAFMLGMDIVARMLLAPQELPIGIITGAVGGSYFCYLLARR
ncbi:FecCD family ABC transporter permease [Aliamphritea spongicola]|uniref:FecCD family ABC transporter permease n=1 Tax=Aliamphritea spongicola TaxID=707589 RepID=UPI001FAF0DDC|nr:iron ABC transporter permease [Aliamphritea spongicola]